MPITVFACQYCSHLGRTQDGYRSGPIRTAYKTERTVLKHEKHCFCNPNRVPYDGEMVVDYYHPQEAIKGITPRGICIYHKNRAIPLKDIGNGLDCATWLLNQLSPRQRIEILFK